MSLSTLLARPSDAELWQLRFMVPSNYLPDIMLSLRFPFDCAPRARNLWNIAEFMQK